MSFLDQVVRLALNDGRLQRLGLRHETQEDLDQQIPVIEFYCDPKLRLVVPEPQPAMKNIAEWWKKIPAHAAAGMKAPRDQFGALAMTAKKCLPLLDGMSLGYTLFSAVDINVRTSPDGKFMEITGGRTFAGAGKHDSYQLGDTTSPIYPSPAIKFHNPWVIRTRPGYSTLFIPPLNRVEEKRFQCLGAVVDTDTYPKEVNFPALWFARDYDGIIRAGTPLVTAIPFKRADVPREALVRTMHLAERHKVDTMARIQDTRSHYYTGELREDRKRAGNPTPPVSGGCPMGNAHQEEE